MTSAGEYVKSLPDQPNPASRWRLAWLLMAAFLLVLVAGVLVPAPATDTMGAPPGNRMLAIILDRAPIPTLEAAKSDASAVVGLLGGSMFSAGAGAEEFSWLVQRRCGSPRVGHPRTVARLPFPGQGGGAAFLQGAYLVGGVGSDPVDLGNSVVLKGREVVWTPTGVYDGVKRTLVLCFGSGERRVLLCTPGMLVTVAPHLLGTDDEGKDVGWRLFRVLPFSALPGLVAVALGVAGGIALGVLGSGFLGLAPMRLGNGIVNLGLSFPQLLVMMMVIAIFQATQIGLMVALGLASAPRVAQVVREKIRSFQRLQFVEAAMELGLSRRRILGRHILWANCRELMFTQATFLFADVVMLEATLSSFRFGSSADIQSLGAIIGAGRNHIQNGSLWMVAPAMLLLLVLILGLYGLGDWMGRAVQDAA